MAGTYNLKVNLSSCSTPISTVSIQVVNSLPLPQVTTPINVLLNGTLTLSANIPGVQPTYHWLGPNNFSATGNPVQRPNFTSADSGTYTVVAKLGNCVSPPVAVKVNLKPYCMEIQLLELNSPVCAPNDMRAVVTSIPNAMYTWVGPDSMFMITTSNNTITHGIPSNVGIWSVTAVVDNCTSNTITFPYQIISPPPSPVINANSPVCLGKTLELTVQNPVQGVSYFWSGPSGFSATGTQVSRSNVTQDMAGVYSLVAVDNGCSSVISTRRISVVQLPSPLTISGSTQICGDNTPLVLTSNAPEEANILWSGPNGFSSTNPVAITTNTSAASAGVYTLQVTANGCPPISQTITVNYNPLPSYPGPTINPVTPICAGQTLQLSAQPPAPPIPPSATIVWIGPGNFVAQGLSVSRPNMQANWAGTYSAVITLAGCSSLVSTVQVSLLPSPQIEVIANNAPVCTGTPINISVTSIPGATYQWIVPNYGVVNNVTGPTIFAPSPLVTPNISGIWSVTAVVNGCASQQLHIPVLISDVPPKPQVPPVINLCTGQNSLNLTVNNPGNYQYRWYGPNNYFATGASPTRNNITSADLGTYSVLAYTSGCTSQMSTTTVEIANPQVPAVNSPINICQGSNATLKVNNLQAGASYLWNGPNGFQALGSQIQLSNVSNTQAGIYTVVAIIGSCTSAASTVQLNLGMPLSLQLISTNSPVCQNQKLKYKVTQHSNVTYHWSYTGFSQATDTNEIEIPALTPINSQIWVKVQSNSCTSDSIALPMRVDPIPTVSLNVSTIKVCEGQVISVTPTSNVSGSTFHWQGPNSFSQSAPALNVTATLSHNGSWSVFAQGPAPTQCASQPVNFQVEVHPRPAKPLLPDSAFACAGENLVWSISNAQAQNTYTWSGPNNFTATGTTINLPSVSTTHVGWYKVYATKDGCVSDTAKVYLAINPQIPAPIISGTTSVCQGSTLSLSINGPTLNTYIWSGPNNFTATATAIEINNINSSQGGQYSVYGFTGSCTSATANFTVTVKPLPAAPVVNSVSVCQGKNAILQVNNPIGGATYQWQDAQNNTYTGAQVIIPNVMQTQQVTVHAIVQGCTSAITNASIEVIPLPSAPNPISLGTVCVGDTVTLSAVPPPNATLHWNGPNNFQSSSFAVVINGVSLSNAGTYSVVSIASGCTSSVATLNLSINSLPPIPQISNVSPTCAGSTLQVTAISPSNAQFIWRGVNNFSAQGNSITFNNISSQQAGTYSVRAIMNGCTSLARNFNVVVNPLPEAPIIEGVTVCSGRTLTLQAISPSGVGFIWSGPGGFSATGNPVSRPSMQQAWAGTYSVQSVLNGCLSSISQVPVTVLETPLPPAITSQGSRCIGSEFALRVEVPVVGFTYYWQGPHNTSNTSTTWNISNLQTHHQGIYSLVAVVNGCTSSITTYNLTPIPLPTISNVLGNTEICEGQNLALTASGTTGASYYWTGPNGFSNSGASITVNSITTSGGGNYQVYAVAQGCTSATLTVPVIVHPIPAPPVAQYQFPACTGQDLILSATSQESGVSYIWYGPNGYVAHSSQSNTIRSTISERAAGVYTVVAKLGNCVSSPSIVKVNVIQTPGRPTIAGKATYCQGDTIKLTGSGHFDATLHWSGPNNFSATGEFLEIPNSTIANAGVYSLVAQRNGCISSVAQLTVSILPVPSSPTIVVPSVICAGSALILTAEATGAETYHWAGPAGFVNNGTQSRIRIEPASIANSGVYSLQVTQNGCTSAVATAAVNITPLPRPPVLSTNSPVCTGSTLQLNASQVAPSATVHWNGPNNFSAQGHTASLLINSTMQAGLYQAYVVAGGCTSGMATIPVRVVVTPTIPAFASNSVNTVCQGDSLLLSVVERRGETYYWQGPQGFIANGISILREQAFAGFAGTYSVVAISEGCTSLPISRNITVTPLPAKPEINGNLVLCSGENLILSISNSDPNAIYEWRGPANFSHTGAMLQHMPIQTQHSGIYSVRARRNGCLSEVAFVEVRVGFTPPQPSIRNNGPICQGESLYFSVDNPIPSVNYIWSGPAGFTSNEASPFILNATTSYSGVYSLQLTHGNCTSAVATTTALVNRKPTPPITGSTIVACEGQNVTLGAVGEAGVQYRWSGPRSYTSTLQRPAISNVSTLRSGIYSVVAVLGNCTSEIATQRLEVSPRPAMPQVRTNAPVCAGQNIVMQAIAQPGANFIWSGPDAFSATGPVVNLLNLTTSHSGIYSVIAVVNNCSSAAANVIITVNPTPNITSISNNGPVCAGSTLQLNVEGEIGVSYLWAGPAGFSSTLPNPSISNASLSHAGVYTLTAIIGNCSAWATTTVQIHPAAPARVVATATTPVCEGNSIRLSTQDYPGLTYRWSGPGGFSSTDKFPVISSATLANSGVYSLVIGNGSCTSEVATVLVIVNPTPAGVTASHNGPLCEGQPLQLTAHTTSSYSNLQYLWQGPDGFSATTREVSIRRPSEGIYTLTVWQGDCSTSVATSRITISPLPTVPKAGTNPVCEGGILELFAASTPGSTFYWQGPNNFTSTFANPWKANVTLADAGIYTVVAILGGCTSQPAFVNVQVQPSLSSPTIQTNSPLCSGQSLVLSAPYIEGASYLWQGPGGFSSSAVQTIVENPVAGEYSLTIRLGRCEVTVPPIPVQIKPIPATPAVVSSVQICSGNNLSLNIMNPEMGATYIWEGPSDFSIETTQNVLIRNNLTTADAGGYFVRSVVNGCTSVAAVTRVIVNSAPQGIRVTSNGPICSGDNLQLTASFMPGVIYYWQGPGNFVSFRNTATLPAVNAGATGVYTLTATLNGCSTIYTLPVVVRDCKKQNGLRELTFAVYPNPSKGQLIITAEGVEEEVIQIRVINNQGQIIFIDEWRKEEESSFYSRDLGSLPSGLYHIQLHKGNWFKTLPWIKN
ncbi:MAG: T9SS type A sorting domain-containing protein [Bacteroidia bacterium]|nr:T9SS type A sorting domain-containing protein [Bacteroidia bacterium]